MQEESINSISRKRKLFTFTVFPIIFIAIFVLIISYYQSNEKNILESYTSKLKEEYEFTIDAYTNTANLVFLNDINRQEVLTILENAKYSKTEEEKDLYRKKLYSELSGIYKNLVSYNFRQLHFHTTDNRSFLRFHKPEKFGDDLTGIRASVEYVNREHQQVSGFEEGRIFNGYRNVFPVFKDSDYLGSVEISVSIGAVVAQIEKRLNEHSDFIILKSVVEDKVFSDELGNYTEWDIDGRFFLDESVTRGYFRKEFLTDRDVEHINDSLTVSMETGTPFSMLSGYKFSKNIIGFLPIRNSAGDIVAYIFTMSDSSKLLSHQTSFRIILLSFISLLFIYTIFIVYMIITDRKVENMVMFDLLTNAFSRRMIFSRIQSEFNRFRRYNSVFSICMIDIDFFKKINDVYGHQAGDSVLTELSDLIRTRIRVSDSLGRYGGEEFLLILPETDIAAAFKLVDKLRDDIASHNFKTVGKVTVSAGLAKAESGIPDCDRLIEIADKNLYNAKQNGRNMCIC